MGTSRSDTVHEADEQWARTASELVAYREQYRNSWGDMDDLILARFLSGEITDDEAERVRRALADHPAVRECIAIVQEVFDQAREFPDPAAASPVNPAWMPTSLSSGVHQDDGLRVGLGDDLAPPPPPQNPGPPLHVAIVGGLCGTAGLIFMLLGVIHSTRSESSMQSYGWLVLALVSGFGIYACVQFIRGQSVKPLMLALSLGVAFDVVGLIAFPIVSAMVDDPDQIKTEVKPSELDNSNVRIAPFEEQIDIQKIKLGVTLVFVHAMLLLYLMSPPVKKYLFLARGERSEY